MRGILTMAALVIGMALAGCDSEKVCPACNGLGDFVDGDHYITCKICDGSGKVSADTYEALTSGPEVSEEPVEVRKYCTMCQGTGKFHAPKSIFVSDCRFCRGTGVADDDRYNTTAALYQCIDCGGRGTNVYDGTTCPTCNGSGLSYQSIVDQINSGPRKSGGQLCGACGGSGVCPVCHGHDRYMIGGEVPYCSTCGNTGKCKWCYGRGH